MKVEGRKEGEMEEEEERKGRWEEGRERGRKEGRNGRGRVVKVKVGGREGRKEGEIEEEEERKGRWEEGRERGWRRERLREARGDYIYKQQILISDITTNHNESIYTRIYLYGHVILTLAQRSVNVKNAAWPAALGTVSVRPNTVNFRMDGTARTEEESEERIETGEMEG